MMTRPRPPETQSGVDPEGLLVDAIKAFATRDFDECRRLLSLAGQEAPASIDVILWSARLARTTEDWEGLKAVSDRWVALEPGSIEARKSLAHALGGLKRWAAAAVVWAELSLESPDDLETLLESVRLNRSCGRPEVAQRCLRNAQAEFAHDIDLMIELVRNLVRSVDLEFAAIVMAEVAAKGAQRTMSLFPELLDRGELVAAAVVAASQSSVRSEYRDELVILADALVQSAIHHEADTAFDQAFWSYSGLLLLDPTDEFGKRGRERSLGSLETAIKDAQEGGEPETIIEISRRVLICQPNNPTGLLAFAGAALKRDEPYEARFLWESVIESGIVSVKNMRDAAQYFEQNEIYDVAIALHVRVGMADPTGLSGAHETEKFFRRLIQIGRASAASDQWLQAGRAFSAVPSTSGYFEEATRRNDQVRRYILKGVRELNRLNDLQGVIDCGVEGLALYPADMELNRMVARAALKLKDFERAQRHWSLLAAHPEVAGEALLGVARSHYGLRQWSECNRAANALLAEDPESVEGARLLETSSLRLRQDAR